MTSAFCQSDKDWTLDLRTSTLIPKYAGTVKELRGDIMVEDRFLKKGSKVYPRDIIKTMEKSFLKLELIDDSVITLGPQSDFVIEKWIYRTKNDREAVFSLMKGKLRAEFKLKSKEKDQLKVRSPLVALGIRGTELTMNNGFYGAKEITQVALLEGKINLVIEDLKERLELKPGDYIEIVKGVKRTKHKSRVMDALEFKELKADQLSDHYNLMRDPKFDVNDEKDEMTEASEKVQMQSAGPTNLADDDKETALVKRKTPKPASLKEKLQILNTTREDNLKE